MKNSKVLDALNEYTDICAQIEETEQDIARLRRRKTTNVSDRVKGSLMEFPYTATHYSVEGVAYTYTDDADLRKEAEVLQERKRKAEEKKLEVEMLLNTIPFRMQRIIKYRLFQGMSWEQTAARLGKKATGDSVRMEFNRFIKKMEEK